ncbi:hypothetical protein HMPREF0103_3505 [Bacteroides sp. 2_1_33B]|nr:hypothetical protein HMPREF0103_3505 [Bacteroides sp. 2_1_33B]
MNFTFCNKIAISALQMRKDVYLCIGNSKFSITNYVGGSIL